MNKLRHFEQPYQKLTEFLKDANVKVHLLPLVNKKDNGIFTKYRLKKFELPIRGLIRNEKYSILLSEVGHDENKILQLINHSISNLDGTKITHTALLGSFFEIAGFQMPSVKELIKISIINLVSQANLFISNNSYLYFKNGHFEIAGIKKPFDLKKINFIENVWLRSPSQPKGKQFVDRGILIFNSDGEALFVSLEFKTKGVARELKNQIAKRDERLFDRENPIGTKMSYQEVGGSEIKNIDLDNLIFLNGGKTNIDVKKISDLCTKIGVKAGSKFNAKEIKDAIGEKYLSITISINTDLWRAFFEELITISKGK